ncbi:MAG: circadian clock protein KaiC, partial [Thermoplasmata archaeon]|nr:circadian clock protein KaiC [Thermoplasmata archaeon]
MAPAPEGRLSTGTEALDVMLHGGFMAKRPYLVVGPSGTGKTTLALQFLCDGIRRGERCLI